MIVPGGRRTGAKLTIDVMTLHSLKYTLVCLLNNDRPTDGDL